MKNLLFAVLLVFSACQQDVKISYKVEGPTSGDPWLLRPWKEGLDTVRNFEKGRLYNIYGYKNKDKYWICWQNGDTTGGMTVTVLVDGALAYSDTLEPGQAFKCSGDIDLE